MVQFYLVPGVRNRRIYLVPRVRNGRIYLVPKNLFIYLFGSKMVNIKHVLV